MIVAQDTAIHDDGHAGRARTLGFVQVDDAVLQPECFQAALHTFIDNLRNVLGAAEDIDDIDANVGRQRIQMRVRLFAQAFVNPRPDWNDTVAGILQTAGNTVTVTMRAR